MMTRAKNIAFAFAVAVMSVGVLLALRTFTFELAALWGGIVPGEPDVNAFAHIWDYFWTALLAPFGLMAPNMVYSWHWVSWFPPMCIGFAMAGVFISWRGKRSHSPAADTPLPFFTWCSIGLAAVLTLFLVVRLTELGFTGPLEGRWLEYNVDPEARHFIHRAGADVTMLAALIIWLPPLFFGQFLLRNTSRSRWVTGYYAALTAIAVTLGLIARQWHYLAERGRLLNTSLCLGAGGPPSPESLTAAAHASVGILYVGMAVIVAWTFIAIFCALRATHGKESPVDRCPAS